MEEIRFRVNISNIISLSVKRTENPLIFMQNFYVWIIPKVLIKTIKQKEKEVYHDGNIEGKLININVSELILRFPKFSKNVTF